MGANFDAEAELNALYRPNHLFPEERAALVAAFKRIHTAGRDAGIEEAAAKCDEIADELFVQPGELEPGDAAMSCALTIRTLRVFR